jgi:hypothetical protein
MKLERAMGGIVVVLAITGILAIGDWLGHPNLVMPEEGLALIPAFIGLIASVIVMAAGVILLTGWLQSNLKRTILYIFVFAASLLTVYICYYTGNAAPFAIAGSALGIILVIMATTAVLMRRYSTNAKTMISKGIAVLILIPFLVGVVGYVMPQWFDAVARTFPDPNLRAAVREAVGKPVNSIGSIGFAQRSDLAKLTKLQAGGKEIRDLTGLQYCTGLTELGLEGYLINDLTPVSNLTSLTRLDLSGNDIHDIRPLERLTKLTTLDLSSNEINDLGPLGNLTKLVSLSLTWNNIGGISPLIQIKTLKTLVLYSNPLNAESVNVYIPQLKQRGVRVVYY